MSGSMGMGHTFDAKLLGGNTTPDISTDYANRSISNPKKSIADDSSRASRMTRLPGLVIKGQGNEEQPLNMTNRRLRQETTKAYALSPKLIRQLRIEEKVENQAEKWVQMSDGQTTTTNVHGHDSTPQMSPITFNPFGAKGSNFMPAALLPKPIVKKEDGKVTL